MRKVFLVLIAFMCSASFCFAQSCGTAVTPVKGADAKAKVAETKTTTQGLKGLQVFPKEKAPQGRTGKTGTK